jgi:hypothetical protein
LLRLLAVQVCQVANAAQQNSSISSANRVVHHDPVSDKHLDKKKLLYKKQLLETNVPSSHLKEIL